MLVHSVHLFFVITIRYFLVAGGAHYFWWVRGKRRWQGRRIQIAPPNAAVRRFEIYYSVLSSIVFALAGGLIATGWEHGWTRLYLAPTQYGVAYLFLSLPLLMLLHDTYFYFTHRLLHRRWFFRRWHRVHHLSHNPTPWAAFSFHPGEAVIEAAILPALVFAIPIHFAVLMIFMLLMTALSVINHLGYELYPPRFARHPVMKWMISAVHHDQHHRYVHCHYGLYFTFWDRLLGTQRIDYADAFAAVVDREDTPPSRCIPRAVGE